MPEAREFQAVEEDGMRGEVRADLLAVPLSALWRAGEPLAGAKGRGGAAVLEVLPGVRAVIRDFRRGGALHFVLPRSYLDPGRPVRELRVLAELRRRGVPVVAPLAALSRRGPGPLHRLRLLTELVEGAVPLPAFVTAHPGLRRAVVHEAGRVVGQAFAAGLYHRDLHPDNLIAREGERGPEVVLLDLDRAELRDELAETARDSMLLRMARYLRRHAARLPVAATKSDELRFLAGLGHDREARREALGRLIPAFVRELARHGLTP